MQFANYLFQQGFFLPLSLAEKKGGIHSEGTVSLGQRSVY